VARQPAIVAELGRPETPEETAARRAEYSRRRRSSQTIPALVVALIASFGIVLFLIVVVVRPEPEPAPPVDYAAIAASADADVPLIVPALPPEWVANAARFAPREQVATWYIGFITPGEQFIAVNQGVEANATWLDSVLDGVEATGTTTIDGVTWSIHDDRADRDAGNHAYALSTELDGSTLVLHGTADDAEFALLAAAIAAEIDEEVAP
jgi:hypothetical protein